MIYCEISILVLQLLSLFHDISDLCLAYSQQLLTQKE